MANDLYDPYKYEGGKVTYKKEPIATSIDQGKLYTEPISTPIDQGTYPKTIPVSGNVTADDATKSRVSTRLERHLAKQDQSDITPAATPSTGGYTSESYQAALGALSDANGGDTLQSVYDQIVNRKPFSYNIDEDMMYRQYVDQYTNLGRLAMNDTIGQAAMLTGGYGNSYGQAVGQQQYDAYLQQLNGIIPDLYDRAYQRYMDEGTALQNKYAFMQANQPSSGGGGGITLPTEVQVPDGWTDADIIKFQKDHGLTPDGQWGPYTQRMYNRVYPNGENGKTPDTTNDTNGNDKGGVTYDPMSYESWSRKKEMGSREYGVSQFKTYQDYLADYKKSYNEYVNGK